MVLKFVNGHVSVVRANMSTKTPKQGQSQAMLTNHGVPDFFPQTALTALVFPCWIPGFVLLGARAVTVLGKLSGKLAKTAMPSTCTAVQVSSTLTWPSGTKHKTETHTHIAISCCWYKCHSSSMARSCNRTPSRLLHRSKNLKKQQNCSTEVEVGQVR